MPGVCAPQCHGDTRPNVPIEAPGLREEPGGGREALRGPVGGREDRVVEAAVDSPRTRCPWVAVAEASGSMAA